MMRIGILLLLAAAVPALAANSVYKWTDKNGRVHYGDAPTTVTAEKLKDAPPPPTSAAAPSASAASPSSSPSPSGSTAPGVAPATTSTAAAPTPSTKTQHDNDCKGLQNQLDVYQTASRVVEKDALGNEHEFSADEKQKLISQTQDKLTGCSSTFAGSTTK